MKQKNSEIKIVKPNQLHIIEAFIAGSWCPVTFGKGAIRLTAPSKMDADHLIQQLITMHINKGRKFPKFRARLMSLDETKEVRRLLSKRGQKGDFGSDTRNRDIPEIGRTTLTE